MRQERNRGHTDGLGKQSKKNKEILNNRTSRRSNFMRKKASEKKSPDPRTIGMITVKSALTGRSPLFCNGLGVINGSFAGIANLVIHEIGFAFESLKGIEGR